MTHRATLAGMACLLAACGTPYVPPPDDNRAWLRVPRPITGVNYFDNGDECGSSIRMLDDVTNPMKRTDRTMPIPAGRRVAVTLLSSHALSTCHISFSFIPQPGRIYEAHMTLDEDRRCRGRIFEPDRPTERIAADIGLRQVRPTPIGSSCRGQ